MMGRLCRVVIGRTGQSFAGCSLRMAVDRTLELLECLEQGGGKGDPLRAAAGLRRRHKKERFAVEDYLSPSLRVEETSAITGDSSSDAEGSTTPPPGQTFLTEAQAIVRREGRGRKQG